MALGDQVGTQAAQDIATGLNQAVSALGTALEKFTTTIAPFLAQVDGDVVGALDRMRTDLVAESTAWRIEVALWRGLVAGFSIKDHL